MRWPETGPRATRSRRFAECSMSMKGTADDDSDELDQRGNHAIAGMGIVAFSMAGDCVGGAGGSGHGCIPQALGAIPDRDRRTWADARRSNRDIRLLLAGALEYPGACELVTACRGRLANCEGQHRGERNDPACTNSVFRRASVAG